MVNLVNFDFIKFIFEDLVCSRLRRHHWLSSYIIWIVRSARQEQLKKQIVERVRNWARWLEETFEIYNPGQIKENISVARDMIRPTNLQTPSKVEWMQSMLLKFCLGQDFIAGPVQTPHTSRLNFAIDEALAWILKYSMIALVRSPVAKKS